MKTISLNLKKWLTLEDAARHLSDLCNENLSKADLLRLALDGSLQLSVNFVNHATAKRLRWVPIDQTHIGSELPNGNGGQPGVTPEVVKADDDVVTLVNVWDLVMEGNERLDVEREYQRLTGGPEVTLTCSYGALVRGSDDDLYQLQNCEIVEIDLPNLKKTVTNYSPAKGLPSDSVLVVRAGALKEFEQAIGRQSNENTTDNDRQHVSDKLAQMNQAAVKFWAHADRNDRSTHPENAMVAAWLEEKGFSSTLAAKAATIIRPEWAPTGRKPEE